MKNTHYENWRKTAKVPLDTPTPEDAWNGAIDHAVKVIERHSIGLPRDLVRQIVSDLQAK